MILVGALQRLFWNSFDDEFQTRGSFSWSINITRSAWRCYLAVEDLTTLARHDCAIGLRCDDRRDDLTGSLLDRIEFAVEQARGAIIGPDPQSARRFSFQCQHTPRRQAFGIDRIRAPPVVTRQSAISRKPSHAKFRLCDRMRAIRWQPVKRRDRSPLMEIRRRCR